MNSFAVRWAIYWIMFICIGWTLAKGQLIDKSKLFSTPTNLSSVIGGKSGDDTTVCVKIWRGRNLKGDIIQDGAHKAGEYRSVHLFGDTNYISFDKKTLQTWRDICLDDALHENLYQYQVQVWPLDKFKTFVKDTANRYLIDETDLTVDQITKLKAKDKVTQSLGNHRIKKEIK